MLRLLLIFSLILGACSEVPKAAVPASLKSVKAIDLSRLNPEDVDIQTFDSPHLKNDLVFTNLRSSYSKQRRFKTSNTPTQKGFHIWNEKEWKRHGKWFFFQDGILQQRVSYKYGAKDGLETVYDSLGVIVSTGTYLDNKHRYTFEIYDEDLTKSKSCYDYLGAYLTCCPYFRCGMARHRYYDKVYGP